MVYHSLVHFRQPFGVRPPNPLKGPHLYWNGLEARQFIEVFHKLPLNIRWKNTMSKLAQHMHLTYKQPVILVVEHVVWRRPALGQDPVDSAEDPDAAARLLASPNTLAASENSSEILEEADRNCSRLANNIINDSDQTYQEHQE